MTTLDIYIDGASKGNPGPSGIGIIIMQDGSVIRQIARFIGPATNNIAEYTALVHGLQEGLLLKADTVRIKSDSELLCRQMNKAYKVRNANIIGLYSQAERLLSGFKEVSIDHIPREQNAHADRLATQAVKDALKR
ncbi:MAG: ribonuclease HI family protein [Candidatus Omnitrophica bacterium]|nr:ribonuclease HI family protein [Candidatus Omnitrophota bacterium]MDD4941192.1 ribonuclease HI family protein [Candidatus Omnitrophota bacterium]MDD5775479.1 ribonuclease HI family protein [Candidatus Omnitrophota bacterium]HNQ51233.1 ribonuclease HI family protein [Candidatus Omnitrophota bacterium]HQO38605.1 ribonuclease HI family protein [Candidatus Omnitrophota bacterium]